MSENWQDGYLCVTGSVLPTGVNTSKCPQGSFWAVGVQTLCTAGTYNTEYAATSSNDCLPWKCTVLMLFEETVLRKTISIVFVQLLSIL